MTYVFIDLFVGASDVLRLEHNKLSVRVLKTPDYCFSKIARLDFTATQATPTLFKNVMKECIYWNFNN
jgi:hypothetical protein